MKDLNIKKDLNEFVFGWLLYFVLITPFALMAYLYFEAGPSWTAVDFLSAVALFSLSLSFVRSTLPDHPLRALL